VSLGDTKTETWFSRLRVGRKADDLVLPKTIVAKSKEMNTGSNLAEYFKEYYGSKRAVWSIMMMMIIMM
jgi:hypothetical protein